MKKKLIIIGLILIVCVGIVLRVFVFKKSSGADRTKVNSSVEYVVAQKTNVIKSCEMIGAIMADKTAQVFPETMGRVLKIMVSDGSRVSKGDRLMVIKNETVGFDFEEAYVTSPISGAVARIFVDIGSMVTPQAPVMQVVDFARVKVAFNAAETEAGCFSRNKKIVLSVDALPDQSFTGSITEISPVIDPMTRTVSIKAAIENPRLVLKPGMTARVLITVAERKDVLALPPDAIINDFLFIVNADSSVTKRKVSTGLVGDDQTEILSGLAEHEMVVVVGQQRLADEEKIIPVKR
ncbi:MAG TPA: efflux RND transporter periplasmic adaptor subunit [bacterium]